MNLTKAKSHCIRHPAFINRAPEADAGSAFSQTTRCCLNQFIRATQTTPTYLSTGLFWLKVRFCIYLLSTFHFVYLDPLTPSSTRISVPLYFSIIVFLYVEKYCLYLCLGASFL